MVLTRKKIKWLVINISMAGGIIAFLALYSFELKLRTSGKVMAERIIKISAAEEGVLGGVEARPGKRVKEGEVLARIYNPALTSKFQELEKSLDGFKARLRLLIARRKSELDTQREVVDEAQAQWEVSRMEYEKNNYYQSIGLITKPALEKSKKRLRINEILLDKEKKVYAKSKSIFEVLERFEQVGWAALDEHSQEKILADQGASSLVETFIETKTEFVLLQESIKNLRVMAPIDGVLISDDLFNREGQPVERGQVIMRLMDTNSLIIYVTLSEKQYAKLNDAKKAYVKLRTKEGRISCFLGELIAVNLQAISADPFDLYETEEGEQLAFREYNTNPIDKKIMGVVKISSDRLLELLPMPMYGMKASVRIVYDEGSFFHFLFQGIKTYGQILSMAYKNKFLLVVPIVYLIFFFLYIVYFLVLPIMVIIWELREERHFKKVATKDIDFKEPVSVILPFYNEEKGICTTLDSLLKLDYPFIEIVMVNDGSNDRSLEYLFQKIAFQDQSLSQYPSILKTKEVKRILCCDKINGRRIILVDKENGGKADALNAGLNITKNELVCFIDGDTILEKNSLKAITQPLITDKKIVAGGGMIRIANGCEIRDGKITRKGLPREIVAQFQLGEYLKAFSARIGWAHINSLVNISGAFCIYRRQYLIEVGGYRNDSIVEDFEITVRLHKYLNEKKIDYKMKTIPDAIAWTECPFSLKGLVSQRLRWFRGFLQCLVYYKRMTFNKKYKRIGFIAMPNLFLFSIIPIISVMNYAILTSAHFFFPSVITAFLWNLFILGIVGAIVTNLVWLLFIFRNQSPYHSKRHMIKITLFTLLEALGYVQLLQVVFCMACFDHFFLKEKKWGILKRRGLEMDLKS